MPGFSNVVLMGHLTRDPELRYTGEGIAVGSLSVAVNHKFTKSDGEKVEEVAFIDVVVWRRQAETCAEFLKKGRPVLVSGRLKEDRWVDEKSGLKRSKLRVVAQQVTFLGSGSKDDEALREEEPAAAAPPAPSVIPKASPKAKQ